MSKVTGFAIGSMFGLGSYKASMFLYHFLSEHSEYVNKIPYDSARIILTTAATAGGIVVGHNYFYNSKLARLHGD